MKTKTISELLQAHTTNIISKESLNSLKGGSGRRGRGSGNSNPPNNDDDTCSFVDVPPVVYSLTDG